MADSIEQAAAAFDVALGNTQKSAQESSADNGPIEVMFGNVGDLEVDDESPARGGGDDDDTGLPIPRKQRAAKAEEDADDFESILDQGEDEDDADAEVADPDEDSEGEEDKKEDEEDVEIYEVVVDGERVEVDLREALDGYIRKETFHRRLNDLSEASKVIRSEAVQVIEDRKRYTDLIATMEAHLEQLVPPEPDWDAEYARDPAAARLLEKKYAEIKSTRAALEAEKGRVSAEQQAQDEAEMKKFISAENQKILANNPAWKDEKVMTRDLTLMMNTGKKAGFSEKEISEVYDSRMINILLKAAKYDRLQESKPKPIRRGKKPLKPGAGSARTAPRGDKAMSNLSRTGSVDDAANVMLQLISPKRKR